MQNLPIYLYPNTLDVILDMYASTKGINQVMYQRDLKVQKGIKNLIQVQFKNSDQKRVTISNTQTFVFSMFDAINRRLIIEKSLEVLDTGTVTTRGLALLTIDESDTLDLDRTSYKYSVKMLDTDGSYTPTYSNTYYNVSGTLHLQNDVMPALKDSTSVVNFESVWNDSTQLYEYSTGNMYASPEFNGNNALHTLAIYMSRFKGTVYIEGTLDNNPGANNNYSVLTTLEYNGFSGINYTNFNGVYSYVRLRYVPAKNPIGGDNRDTAYAGTVDKILYRS
jgi:hypothetical protein